MPDPQPLTAAERAAIRRRLKMTTCGPWDANGPMVTSETVDEMLISLERYPGWEFDAEFIASAPDDVARLLATVVALEAERDQLDAQIAKLADYIMLDVPGEPSQSEGAVDTATRVLAQYAAVVRAARAWAVDHPRYGAPRKGCVGCDALSAAVAALPLEEQP